MHVSQQEKLWRSMPMACWCLEWKWHSSSWGDEEIWELLSMWANAKVCRQIWRRGRTCRVPTNLQCICPTPSLFNPENLQHLLTHLMHQYLLHVWTNRCGETPDLYSKGSLERIYDCLVCEWCVWVLALTCQEDIAELPPWCPDDGRLIEADEGDHHCASC